MSTTQAMEPECSDSDESPSLSLLSEDCWGELLRTNSFAEGEIGYCIVLQGPMEKKFVIGRDPNADICVNDPHVSSRHCTVFRDEHKAVWVEDHSLSGTFVNSEKVEKNTRKRLFAGDSLCLLRPSNATIVTSKKMSPAKTKAPTAFHEFIFKTYEVKVGPCSGDINQKYEIFPNPIGSGSFAEVYKGHNRRTGAAVAVKVVDRKQFQFQPKLWEDQMREIDMLKLLNHDACVKMLDTYSSAEGLYIVMEFISGGELFDKIVKNGKLNEAATRVLIKRLLEAVQYLHSKGIVHRDLKPENILMLHKEATCYHIKVADFGVARLVGGGCKTVTGSMSYIAPEVLERRDTVYAVGTYDAGCDLWSVGVIAFVCLMGKLPFRSLQENDNVVQDLVTASKLLLEFKDPDWDGISEDAKDFFAGVLQPDSSQRFTAKQALEHPWIKAAGRTVEGETCMPNAENEIPEDDTGAGKRSSKRMKLDTPQVPLFSQ